MKPHRSVCLDMAEVRRRHATRSKLNDSEITLIRSNITSNCNDTEILPSGYIS